jgi:uncharacterized protein YegP (UPF0339 family)
MAIERISKFRIERNRAGKWFWHEIAGNGEIIGTSGQDFFSQEDAKRAVENAKASAAAAPVEVSNPNQAMNELIRRMMAEREERSVMRSVKTLTERTNRRSTRHTRSSWCASYPTRATWPFQQRPVHSLHPTASRSGPSRAGSTGLTPAITAQQASNEPRASNSASRPKVFERRSARSLATTGLSASDP